MTRGPTLRPSVLVVRFRLRLVRGRGHAVFRWESCGTPPSPVGAECGCTIPPRHPAFTCCCKATRSGPAPSAISGPWCTPTGSPTAAAGLVVVRPDGYIGLRSAVADVHRLRDWLALVGVE